MAVLERAISSLRIVEKIPHSCLGGGSTRPQSGVKIAKIPKFSLFAPVAGPKFSEPETKVQLYFVAREVP